MTNRVFFFDATFQLVDEDEPLFLSLLVDLFPGLILTSKTYPDLVAAITQQCDEQKLIDWPNWRLKVNPGVVKRAIMLSLLLLLLL